MNFGWDIRKAALNLEKHGVSFEEAVTAFDDARARIFPDLTHSEGEDREILVGFSARHRLLLVSFRERDEMVRIISARTATPRERRKHEENS
ncbi:MAG: BrnT family toxin [Thermoanaerobaculia bacterium]